MNTYTEFRIFRCNIFIYIIIYLLPITIEKYYIMICHDFFRIIYIFRLHFGSNFRDFFKVGYNVLVIYWGEGIYTADIV